MQEKMEIIYCNKCLHLQKKKAGTGDRFYCEKHDRWFPINFTQEDVSAEYCVEGKLPRREHNTRCGNNTWD